MSVSLRTSQPAVQAGPGPAAPPPGPHRARSPPCVGAMPRSVDRWRHRTMAAVIDGLGAEGRGGADLCSRPSQKPGQSW